MVSKESVGTHFSAIENPLESRKQWILAGPATQGSLVLDAGAVKAVTDKGRSLLSKGIVGVKGQFERGATLQLVDQQGKVIAKGMTRYCGQALSLIAGKHSDGSSLYSVTIMVTQSCTATTWLSYKRGLF